MNAETPSTRPLRLHLAGIVTGLLFVLIGAVLSADAYLSWDLRPEVLWPALLIAGGLVILVRGARRTSS